MFFMIKKVLGKKKESKKEFLKTYFSNITFFFTFE